MIDYTSLLWKLSRIFQLIHGYQSLPKIVQYNLSWEPLPNESPLFLSFSIKIDFITDCVSFTSEDTWRRIIWLQNCHHRHSAILYLFWIQLVWIAWLPSRKTFQSHVFLFLSQIHLHNSLNLPQSTFHVHAFSHLWIHRCTVFHLCSVSGLAHFSYHFSTPLHTIRQPSCQCRFLGHLSTHM